MRAAATQFDRDLVGLLGLPFDVVDMKQAVGVVRRAAFTGQKCFISTPNLNFLVAAQTDVAFRDSVIHSDLSLADGMPLVWVSKLLGLPIRERVPGAGLFEELGKHSSPPVKVHFIGGPAGMAQRAHERLNRSGCKGTVSVGYVDPGSCSIDGMSALNVIETVNHSMPQFVVVALGAKKGQRWIERNRDRLNAPVISHLGAVVNFVAGSIQRAPVAWQRLGLEWAWRIKQEPGLWRRYWRDGLHFLGLMLTRVLPHALFLRRDGPERHIPTALSQRHRGDGPSLILGGAWTVDQLGPLRRVLKDLSLDAECQRLTMDLAQVTHVDSHFIGLMMLTKGVFDQGLSLEGASPQVTKVFRYHLADYLLQGAR